jgi:MSHA biogenesis protein MshP
MKRSPLRAQRGLSLLAAIFMLLLFAALAAYMAGFSGTASVTSAQDVQGMRAHHAAEAGIEWGLYRVLVDDACVSATLPAPIGDFTVTVNCVSSGPFNEAGSDFSVYRLTARAAIAGQVVGSPGFVERESSATVVK